MSNRTAVLGANLGAILGAIASLGLLAGCAGQTAGVPPATAAARSATADHPTGAQIASEEAATANAVAAPCAEPASMPHYTAPADPAHPVTPELSDKARQTRRNGCAGVKFHIAGDGSVTDASLVTEAPRGYAFGQAALDALSQTRFDPKQARPGWYYVDSVYVQRVFAGDRAPIDINFTLTQAAGLMPSWR